MVDLARSTRRTAALEAAGAHVVVADALDRDQLLTAVRQAAPDAVVNLLTAIPAARTPTTRPPRCRWRAQRRRRRPAPLHVWLPEFAAGLGAPAPERAPAAPPCV
ncbi:hypothetical protein AB0L71_16405 [Streptomyces sp. NPDC052052]|uniref:hypothetical protein n=1 Tax=Streptomyces sp. NPDC052052 TaxID=3154756 RepID=UPI00342898AD